MTDEDLKFYRRIAAQRDLFARVLNELLSEPAITIAEHADQTPWLKNDLRKIQESGDL